MTNHEEMVCNAMRRSDLRTVLTIETDVFDEPWNMAIFLSELSLKGARSYRCARLGRQVVGYRGLMFVDESAHITTIAVDPNHQRSRIGTALMFDAIEVALERQCTEMTLEVATTNERAQSLYRRFGFAPVGVRKRYYQRTGTDALIMTAEGIDTPAYATRLAGLRADRVAP